MARKKPGSLDWRMGDMRWFVCYCQCCDTKVLLRRDDYQQLLRDLSKRRGIVRWQTKKVLTHITEKL